MNPLSPGESMFESDIPRGCGGEPLELKLPEGIEVYSPRMRG